jgi:hypothetical protein
MQAKLAMQVQSDTKTANFSRCDELLEHMASVCRDLNLTAELQHITPAQGIVADNLICTVPARMFAEGNEAIVLSSHLVQSDNDLRIFANPGAVFLLSLAHTLTRARWLAKDVIVVLTSNRGHSDLSNFLDAYDTSPDSISRINPLRHHSGPIRGALIIDFPASGAVDRLLLLPHTGDGRVPELDFFTLIANAMRAPVHVWDASSSAAHAWLYHHRKSLLEYLQRDGAWIAQFLAPAYGLAFPGNKLHQIQVAQYTERIVDMVADVLLALFTPAECRHCDFVDRNYQAMTIKGLAAVNADTADESRWIAVHGSAFEKVVKALSNADERLHAGATAYTLMGANYFLGMSEYAISIGIFLIPTVLMTVKSMPPLTHVPIHLATTCALAAALCICIEYGSAASTAVLAAPIVLMRIMAKPVDHSAFFIWQLFGFSQFCLMYSHGMACIVLCIVCIPVLLVVSAAVSSRQRWVRVIVQLILYITAVYSQVVVSASQQPGTFEHFGRMTSAKLARWVGVLLWLVSATI